MSKKQQTEIREVGKLYTFKEALEYLSIHDRTLRKWIGEGIVSHLRVKGEGGSYVRAYRFKIEDLDDAFEYVVANRKHKDHEFWSKYFTFPMTAAICNVEYDSFVSNLVKKIPKGKIGRYGNSKGVEREWLTKRVSQYLRNELRSII